MKILMVAPGKSIHAQRPLKWLLDRGCRVTLLDSFNPYPERRRNYQFIPDLRIRGRGYYQKLLGVDLADKFALFLLGQELRCCRRYLKPDITHIHWADRERSFACVRAGLRPLILSVWGSDINGHLKPGANAEHQRKVGRVLAGVDLVIVDSREVGEKCAQLAGREIATQLLPLGIDTNLFRPDYAEAAGEWRRRLAIPQGAKVFLSIRALGPNYGQELILEAFARALPHLKQDAILVFKLYGKPLLDSPFHDFESTLRRRVRELGLDQTVRWLEQVEYGRVPELYAMADVIVNYPMMDAFPVTFLEAAACERPVITVRLPAYAGTFAEKYFQMVEPGKIGALAAAMAAFVNEPSEHNSQFPPARRVVVAEYDETLSAKKLMAIYQQTIAASPMPRDSV